jgi:hypothetical protein
LASNKIMNQGKALDWKGFSMQPSESTAQNTGIAAVGPGPGSSLPTMEQGGAEVSPLASVADLVEARAN